MLNMIFEMEQFLNEKRRKIKWGKQHFKFAVKRNPFCLNCSELFDKFFFISTLQYTGKINWREVYNFIKQSNHYKKRNLDSTRDPELNKSS